MKNVVIDTSIFTNPNIYKILSLGQPIDAVESFLALAHKSSKNIFMPRTIYEELCKVIDLEPLKGKFESIITIKSPNRCNISINASLLFEFIEDMRIRINKGLRISEEIIKDKDLPTDKAISRLREKYKEALRQGTLDSKEDMDTILLSLELNAALLSADEGIQRWADKFGVRVVNPLYIQEFFSV